MRKGGGVPFTLEEILRSYGYEVITMAGAEAKLCQSTHAPFEAVLLHYTPLAQAKPPDVVGLAI